VIGGINVGIGVPALTSKMEVGVFEGIGVDVRVAEGEIVLVGDEFFAGVDDEVNVGEGSTSSCCSGIPDEHAIRLIMKRENQSNRSFENLFIALSFYTN
jgi:hypothetical protein